MDQVYRLDLLGPTINFDSIKMSGAMISAYSELFGREKTNKMLHSEDFMLKVTDPFPMYDGDMFFPTSNMSFSLGNETSFENKRNAMLNRKTTSKLASLEAIRKLSGKIAENSLSLQDFEEIMKNSKLGDKRLGLVDIQLPGLNISDPEARGIFTKEASMVINGSLWVAIKTSDENFISCLNYLQVKGISGRLSSGFGRFKMTCLSQKLDEGFVIPGLYLNLMPFIPTEESIENIDLSRSFITTKIFTGTNRNGKDLGIFRYISSGSLVFLNGHVSGEIVHLPTHGEEPDRLLDFSGYLVRV